MRCLNFPLNALSKLWYLTLFTIWLMQFSWFTRRHDIQPVISKYFLGTVHTALIALSELFLAFVIGLHSIQGWSVMTRHRVTRKRRPRNKAYRISSSKGRQRLLNFETVRCGAYYKVSKNEQYYGCWYIKSIIYKRFLNWNKIFKKIK